tara:strand:- start:658 stop:1218 length:561 start_codon:yes stop_codon:yes gene_type:complete
MSDKDTSEDAALWAWLTQDVKPLKKDRKSLNPPEPSPVEKTKIIAQPIAQRPPPHKQEPSRNKQIHKTSKELDKRTDDRLRKGQLPIEGIIDLHGLSKEQAHYSLKNFILKMHAQNKRSLLVITGKGQKNRDPLAPHDGVIKKSLPFWFNESPFDHIVLKHYSAKPKDGGSGAFYVYLRRSQHNLT